jgi:hypothetical protein
MAASTYKITFSNGQVLSVYQASSQAVNSNPVNTFQGAAAVTTVTTDFSPQTDCYILDILVPAALTAGGVEFYNVTQGKRTERGESNLEGYLSTNTTRTPPKIGLKRGNTYRLIQTVAGNA